MESGVITVEACTSLMIFVFAFYILLELMKSFAVEACMQDVLSSIALDVSMGNYYDAGYYSYDDNNTRLSYRSRSMTNLVDDDLNDERITLITGNMSNFSYSSYEIDSLYEYYMKDNNNLSRLLEDDKVYWKNISVSTTGYGQNKKIIVTGDYGYRIVDVPFFNEDQFYIWIKQKAETYAWN